MCAAKSFCRLFTLLDDSHGDTQVAREGRLCVDDLLQARHRQIAQYAHLRVISGLCGFGYPDIERHPVLLGFRLYVMQPFDAPHRTVEVHQTVMV